MAIQHIYPNKGWCAFWGKAGHDPICQCLESDHFACNVICKQDMDYQKDGRIAIGNYVKGYRKTHARNIVVWAHLKENNSGAKWRKWRQITESLSSTWQSSQTTGGPV